MLVLQRYEGQSIRVDDDVLITVLQVIDGTDDKTPYVRIGIAAPINKRILREELWNKNQLGKADAANKP